MRHEAHPLSGRGTVRLPQDGDDEWSKTRAMTTMSTQVFADKQDYLDGGDKDIGRRTGPDRYELFVVCDPAEALSQQLVHLAPEYIALHDAGTAAGVSSGLLRMVAAALQRPVQVLAIRRQGYGVTLATLEFVELPVARNQASLRLYGTRVNTDDGTQRQLIARTLLEHARLGVVLVDGAPPRAGRDPLTRTLADEMIAEGWRSRQWLFVPLGAAASAALNEPGGPDRQRVGVLTAAPVAGPAQAWGLIQDVWGQIRSGRAPRIEPPVPPQHLAPQAAPTTAEVPRPAVPLRPMPAVTPPIVAPGDPESAHWNDYARACSDIAGLVSCCVFDVETQRTLAFAGLRPGPASLAAQGAALHRSAVAAAKALGLPPGRPELAISVEEHHLVLHPIPGHPALMLHAVFDAHVANLTLVRLKLQRLGLPG